MGVGRSSPAHEAPPATVSDPSRIPVADVGDEPSPAAAEQTDEDKEKQIRTIPWCTIILVTLALTCHSLVLCGNLMTSRTFNGIGQSTDGWSTVGLSLSSSMKRELDYTMRHTVSYLTDALHLVVKLEDAINMLVGETANSTDEAASLLQHPKMKTHPIMFKGELTLHSKMSRLSFAEIPRDGKVEIHEEASFMQTDLVERHRKKGQVVMWTPNTSVPSNIEVVRSAMKEEVQEKVGKVEEIALNLMDTALRPALEQVEKWQHSMGDKMLGTIEQFSTTIDKVQKIFDQIMEKLSGASIAKEILVYDTYYIFDADQSGTVSLNDILDTGDMYGITAFHGRKASQLFDAYDEDKDGELDMDEYSKLVDDDSIPSAMTYVLRQYSKKLAQVSGNVAAARKRDEVAETVVKYFTIIAAKNHTKVAWVSNRLTNGSLVMDFTADVLKQLAQNVDNPVQLTKLDIGQIVIDEMMLQEPEYTQEALHLMSDPDWWESQGFDSYQQPKIIKRVTAWISKSPSATNAFLLQGKQDGFYKHLMRTIGIEPKQVVPRKAELPVDFAENMGAAAYDHVYKDMKRWKARKRKAAIAYLSSLFAAKSSSHLFTHLLGTRAPAGSGEDDDVIQALNSGVDALPETLEFAQFLSLNASEAAKRFESNAFDYAKTSSNALESFANQIKGMVDKVSGFLNEMTKYATPRGMQELEDQIHGFVENTHSEVMNAVDLYLNQIINETFSSNEFKDASSVLGNCDPDNLNASCIDVSGPLSGVLSGLRDTKAMQKINKLIVELKSLLPTVINDLKYARKEVSSVSETLQTTFSGFQEKGPPIFENISSLYKTLWVVYFIFFALMTFNLLFYGFWASGWFGGPPQAGEDEPPQPTSFKERCYRCCRACNWCMHEVHNGHLFFWSCIIIAEVIILVMFVVSIVLSILAGIKVFINVGCAQIYILGDDDVCSGALNNLRKFLQTFWTQQETEIHNACDKHTLTACKEIMDLMVTSAIFTTGGSFAAAIFSFQMLFESASLHEKARWFYLTENAIHAHNKNPPQ